MEADLNSRLNLTRQVGKFLESLDKCLGGNSKFLISNLSYHFLFITTGFME